ncbi:MAG: S41 family peptidase [Calditrichaeota bacterium]|nr:S41 family peptidase [Calditrichota bacterium]MCB9365617.1 S41 family peptidase [Calditrichota bacterium]
MKRRLILLLILMAPLAALGETRAMSSDELYAKIHHNMGLFGDIYREISMRYVDQVDPDEFMEAGIEGMLATLDPYTVYIPEEDTDDLDVITYGKYGGVGIEIGVRGEDKVLTVISAMDDSPAQRVGMRSGDRVIAVEGQSTVGMTTRDASRLLRGEPDSKVRITVERPGAPEPIEFVLTRQVIDIKDVPYRGFVEPGIGYIKLAHFSTRAQSEMDEALIELQSKGLEALVLDLRGNPGGLMNSAVGVLQKFLDKGEMVVSTKGRTSDANRMFKLGSDPIAKDIPIAVLIDGGSASASEIVAGAIQDLDRGVLIGEPTFGKGLVQSVISFETGEALKLTTAKYFTPSGRLIQKVDYFNHADSGLVVQPLEEAPDSGFVTRNGRKVEGGGGIEPDILVETPQPGQLGVELWRQGSFFDFVTQYMAENQEITDATVSDAMIEQFRDWLTEKDFSYSVDGEKELNTLREILASVDAEGSAEGDFAHLEHYLELVQDRDFDSEREFVRSSLETELANSLYGSTGRIEASFDHDPQILRAVDVLRDKVEYGRLLAVSDSTDKPNRE